MARASNRTWPRPCRPLHLATDRRRDRRRPSKGHGPIVKLLLCADALQPQLSGIGRYTWELATGLPAVPDVERVQCYARRQIVDDPASLLLAGRGAVRRPRTMVGRWAKRRRAERAFAEADLVHGPNYFLPDRVEGGIITIH